MYVHFDKELNYLNRYCGKKKKKQQTNKQKNKKTKQKKTKQNKKKKKKNPLAGLGCRGAVTEQPNYNMWIWMI